MRRAARQRDSGHEDTATTTRLGGLLGSDAILSSEGVDLCLHEGSEDPSRTERIARDVARRILQRDHLRQAIQRMLRGDVRRLVHRRH